MMAGAQQQKYDRLKQILADCGKVMVALSGGLDSSFLLFAAADSLGVENVFAAIGISPSLADADYKFAEQFCTRLGLPSANILPVRTEEIDDPNYRKNDFNRCFFCKRELFGKLRPLAQSVNVEIICDGTNASDTGDFRPGSDAAKKADVRSPLLEAGLTKNEIRALARSFDLEIWDKPQSACLASRIPYNSEVTIEKLRQIEQAELFLKSLGFRELRVRHHGDLARIELPPDDMRKVIENGLGKQIIDRFREIGFLFTTIDIAGLKSGSMNIMLKGGKDV
jgi:uncharacterized protein